jgi:hypothetical protein
MTDYHEDNLVNYHIRSLGNSINQYYHKSTSIKVMNAFVMRHPWRIGLANIKFLILFLCLFLNAAGIEALISGSVAESCNELHVYDQPSISDLVAYI